MNNIKLLDCTLRDGGYVNYWNFGFDNIKKLISELIFSKIDMVECGFLTNKSINQNQSLYNSIYELNEYIPDIDKTKLSLMIAYSKYSVSKLPEYNSSVAQNIRYIFKKNDIKPALIECESIKQKGYNLFINPTYISEYTFYEFNGLVDKINKINPYCFSIVDSIGILDSSELLKLLKYADDNLKKEISICVHLHNNLGIAFENVRNILNQDFRRNLVIDSTIRGIGRGAGNLPVELIAMYLNKKFAFEFDIKNIYKIYEDLIAPLSNLSSFKMENAYYYSAINRVHPNYADFIIKNNIKNNSIINKILKSIPKENKIIYDEDLIRQIASSI